MTRNTTVRSSEERTTDDATPLDDTTTDDPSTDGTPGPADRSYRLHHDFDGDRRLSVSVVQAVSDALGVDPLELDERLYEVVDPDALDRLFGRCGSDACRVTFELCGCSVTVRADGRIVVRGGARSDVVSEQ